MNHIVSIDPSIKVRKYEDLIHESIVINISEFNENVAKDFRINFDKAHRINQKFIPVIIDSYGGYCHSLLSMISTIENSRIPVITVVTGKAMSAGGLLAAFGCDGYRFIDKNACFMMHDITSGQYGKVNEIISATNEIIRLNDLIYSKLDIKCKKNVGFFKQLVHGKADLYLTPEQVVSYGLADTIGYPRIDISVKVETSIIYNK